MTIKHKGNILKDEPDGPLLKDEKADGDLLKSEGPQGNPLWKQKKRLDENGKEKELITE